MKPQIQQLRVNGVPDAGLSALDRGLHYGDGLFETIACLKGRPRFLPLHLERLEFGCERLGITTANLEDTHAEILAMAAGVERAVLKVIVTAGEALARGYARSGAERATRITIRYSWPPEEPAQLQDGVVVRTLSLRLGENPRLAGLKHSNRLEQVLARLELSADPEVAEGLLYSSSGNLVAATTSNVFVVRGGSLLTPRIDQCGVAGVMRRVVLREARQVGVPARECELRAQDVQDAEEIFLTNALIGIRPVRRLDARELTPGPLTRHLQSVLAPLLNEP
ncbi:MAG: aminodeoxychorismate lyase [Sinobacteraceae bacterium]|nr:aminodeoxychorismate lyase [Nevskiaceae bacterium]